MILPILTAAIEQEADVVAVRQRAKRIAELVGFDAQDQTRVATAVSEIARNAFTYGGGGRAEFAIRTKTDRSKDALIVRILDSGKGIRHLSEILDGRHRSQNGMGVGIIGARRLMDHFVIESVDGQGTRVELSKFLPRNHAAPSRARLGEIAEHLRRERADDPLVTLRDQNRDLMRGFADLRERQDELERLNRELEETNRGVVALYAELDQRAEELKAASDLKSRFLSHMSHEFRTPLNSILALSRLLLDRIDGPLSAEQERQVGYIRRSAESLTEMVNDLLDLAKVEAGRIEVRLAPFKVEELFTALRGALRPLQTSDTVSLVFEEAADLPPLLSDEAKVAQILRNLIANALKFTEAGEVRVSATYDAARDVVAFSVRDTGIGIAPEHLDLIFEEFSQVQNKLQNKTKGTGLGLPLSRKLANLLGSTLEVTSSPGTGSTFCLTMPRTPASEESEPLASGRPVKVLIVDDDEQFRYVVRQMLGARRDIEMREAADGAEGVALIRGWHPDVVLLDVEMPGLNGPQVVKVISNDDSIANVAVIVATSHALSADVEKALQGVHSILKKDQISRETLLSAIRGGYSHHAA